MIHILPYIRRCSSRDYVTNQAGVEAVGEGVPLKGHGQGVGRYLSPLQGRSLLPWNSDLPSSHHASSARRRLEMHVRTDEV